MKRPTFRHSISKTAHIIVKVRIAERPASLFPLLGLSDGSPSLLVATYARDLQRRNWSPEKVYGAVAAIGRLYDYYTLKFSGATLEPRQQRTMFQQFAEARLRGTIHPDGALDPGGLNWHRVRFRTVKKDIAYLTEFSRWLTDNFGFSSLNPLEEKYASTIRDSYETEVRMSTDLLAHLLPAKSERTTRPQFELHNNTGAHFTDIPKSFPASKVVELINAAPNLRDKMAYLLMGFGSLRISEAVHVFLEDAFGVFRDTGAANVRLGHPAEGYYEWADGQSRPRCGTRAEFLMEMYGRVPRTEMEGMEFYAGWKGMEFGNTKNTGFVYWSSEEAGIYFRKLLYDYFDEVFKGKPEGWPHHPYLFVKTDRQHFGEPVTIANLANQFYAAAERIGLDRRQPGVNPHGLRHFYGFYCADVLGIDLTNLQKQMHHASPISTLAYHHITPQKVREQLKRAQIEVLQHEHDVIKREFKNTSIVFPNSWGPSPGDPFGLRSYFHHRG